MSQVDSLLDLGEVSSATSATITNATTGATTTTTTTVITTNDGNSGVALDDGDPFDPFAVTITTTSLSSPNKQTSADPFDPFGQLADFGSTNGNLDSLDTDVSLSTTSPPTTLLTGVESGETQDDLTRDDLLGDYLVTTDTKKQDNLFSDSITSPSADNPLYDMSMSSLTDITPPKAYLDDDLLSSPLDPPTSNGGLDPFLDLQKNEDSEVSHITESNTDADGSFQITTTTIISGNKLAGQEAQFDDLLDDLDSTSPPPISSAPPEAQMTSSSTYSFSDPFLDNNNTTPTTPSTVSSNPFSAPQQSQPQSQSFNPFAQVNSESYTEEVTGAFSPPVQNSVHNNPFRIDSSDVVITRVDPEDVDDTLIIHRNVNRSDSFDQAYELNVPVLDEMSNSDILSPIENENNILSPVSNDSHKYNKQEAIVDMIKNTTNEIPIAPVTITTSVPYDGKDMTSPKSESTYSESLSTMSASSVGEVTSPTRDETEVQTSDPVTLVIDRSSPVLMSKDRSFEDLKISEKEPNMKSPDSVTSPVEIKITPTPAPRSNPPTSSYSTRNTKPYNSSASKKTPSPDSDSEVDVDPITGVIVPRRPKPAFLQNLLAKKEEEEEAARESVTSPLSQDGSTGSAFRRIRDDRPKSPVDQLYENLPDVQMPKRYTKPEEKETTKNAPKVLIMGLPNTAPVQSYLKPKEQSSKEKEPVQIDPANIVRAEDKVEDDLENLPDIGNLRSRFESKDKTPPPLEEKKPAKLRQSWASSTPAADEMDSSEPTRVNGVHDGEEIAREKRGREEVGSPSEDIHFDQMNNIRNRFENIASEQKESQRVRRESASSEEGDTHSDLPPPEQTRGLLARFRQMEIEAEQEVVPDRKPVRKITPPRQDIDVRTGSSDHEITPERDPNVIRHDDRNPEEEEMPPAAITKNLLAKFKSWEKTNEEPPSPALSELKQKAALNKPKYSAHSRAAAFENAGAVERENAQEVQIKPLVQATEHGVFENTPNERPELVRETEQVVEEDLPAAGVTKSLLAQWKSMENVVETPKERIPTPKKRFPTSKPAPSRNSDLARSSESLDSSKDEVNSQPEQQQQELVKESDTTDDKEAIPPAFTRNLVAKFQQLSDSDRENTPPPSKKTPGSKKKTQSLSSAYDTTATTNTTTTTPSRRWSQPEQPRRQPEPEIEAEPEPELQQSRVEPIVEVEREIVRADDPADHEDELPPPAFTKNLLARFKSMEDLSRPAPTPELDLAAKKSLALEKKKALDPNRRKSSPAGMFPAKLTPHKIDYDENEDHYAERQQPEGGEYANGHAESLPHEDQPDTGDAENTPVVLTDIVRESDSHFEEELPEVGTTKSLLAKFQSMTHA